eukprot:NODE_2717_length_1509_cov_41.745310_g2341_i0.p1 GENE.NODE_2717_length_1509_cov_41.745310_g2341_i0~~NODE_2717_length_1509_cov_41.745310_g2341_i0.p1  ORF type:complete len:469 (+),score=83.96 NODE_2717_length_1509_cov_41.745310_g2341_i0:44-1408(+)
MTSTMVTAMGEGLVASRLFSSVMEVKHAAVSYSTDRRLLGGEQKRELIPGFDRDNSPLSFLQGTEERTALFLTTNGTRAIPWVRSAKMLVLGCFLNLSAILRTIMFHASSVESVVIVCSGTDRGQTRAEDDELCAAYILRSLIGALPTASRIQLDETATSILQQVPATDKWAQVCEKFRRYPAAHELRKLGLESDIEFCLQVDKYHDTLPVYCKATDTFLRSKVHYEIPLVTLPSPPASPTKDDVASTSGKIEIYLIRSDMSGPQLRGRIDHEIGELGQKMAADIISLLSKETINVLVSSPLRRARAAAELVAKQHGLTPEIHSGFSSMNFGDWTGLTRQELNLYYPGALEKWESEPDFNQHGGESYSSLCNRVQSAFDNVLQRCIENKKSSLCIVAHQSTIRSILVKVQNLSQKEWPKIVVPGDSLTRLEYYINNTFNPYRVLYVGRTIENSS